MVMLRVLALCAVLMAMTTDAVLHTCTFDFDFCNWSQDSTDDSFWTKRSGGTPSDNTGPNSGFGGRGSYIYIEASDQSTGQKSRIISTILEGIPSGPIVGNLTFQRSMYGAAMGTLRIYTKTAGNSQLTQLGTTLRKTSSRSWNWETIPFTCLTACQLVFEATRGSDYTSDVAIDQVSISYTRKAVPTVTTGLGNSSIHYSDHSHYYTQNETHDAGTQYCSFDHENCSYLKQDPNSELQWTKQTSGDSSVDTGPESGYGGDGCYLLMDASNGQSGDKARLISDVISQASVNLTFWYSMYGYDVGALRVYIKDANGERLAWERTGDQETRDWINENITFSNDLPCQVVFEAERGVFRHGDIGLDEISMAVSHVMKESKADSESYEIRSCDFESKAFCGWSQSRQNKVQWELWDGPTPKSNTGPRGDYTTGDGRYALFQDATSRANQTAVLTSNVIRAPLYRTLHIAYHKLGYHGQNSRLNVYTVLESNGSRTRVWSNTQKEDEREWQAQLISVMPQQPYSFEIEAVGGNRGYGDIAIDNLRIKSGVLPHVASCDFKSSFCSWRQRDDDDFDWLLNTGETSTKNTGPMGKDIGSYVYAEASFPRKAGDIAIIESPVIGPLGYQSTCVRFEYNMYGSQVGKLQLVLTDKNGGSANVLWTITGSQGQKWHSVYKSIPTGAQEFRFQFRAQRKNGIRGDVAVRGVEVEGNACEEEVPYDCDFDSDMCDWKPPTSGPTANWTYSLVSPGGDTDSSPPVDHTAGSAQGGYMYVSNSPIQATIQTLVTTKSVLCVRFWYFAYGNDNTGAFEFLTQPKDAVTPTVKWTSYRETVAWQRASVTVQSNAEYYMGFRAKAVDGYKAVDDITVDIGQCV